jgi:uncharacterized DUF497 family protein
VRWTWDANKDRNNRRAHGLGFETARLVFDYPLAVSCPDPNPSEARWQTIGLIANVVVLVVHARPDPEPDAGEELGRIIGARKATRHESEAHE